MKINWDQIVTNTVSALITAIVIGAAVIVWKGATSVDQKVTMSTQNIKTTVVYAKEAVDVMQQEMLQLRHKDDEITIAINNLTELVESINESLNDKPNVTTKTPQKTVTPELSHKKLDRINRIELPKRNYIQQQLPEMPEL